MKRAAAPDLHGARPLLYKDAQELTEYVSQAMMGGAAKEAAVLLYAPEADPYFEELERFMMEMSICLYVPPSSPARSA